MMLVTTAMEPATSLVSAQMRDEERDHRSKPVQNPSPGDVLLTPRDASPVSIGKDGYQSNDEDDPKPGRHGDPFP